MGKVKAIPQRKKSPKRINGFQNTKSAYADASTPLRRLRRKPVEKINMNLSPRSRATEIAKLCVSVAIFDSLNFLVIYP